MDTGRKLRISAKFVAQLSMSQFDHTVEYSPGTAGFPLFSGKILEKFEF